MEMEGEYEAGWSQYYHVPIREPNG
jgi:hypothetical protein